MQQRELRRIEHERAMDYYTNQRRLRKMRKAALEAPLFSDAAIDRIIGCLLMALAAAIMFGGHWFGVWH